MEVGDGGVMFGRLGDGTALSVRNEHAGLTVSPGCGFLNDDSVDYQEMARCCLYATELDGGVLLTEGKVFLRSAWRLACIQLLY